MEPLEIRRDGIRKPSAKRQGRDIALSPKRRKVFNATQIALDLHNAVSISQRINVLTNIIEKATFDDDMNVHDDLIYKGVVNNLCLRLGYAIQIKDCDFQATSETIQSDVQNLHNDILIGRICTALQLVYAGCSDKARAISVGAVGSEILPLLLRVIDHHIVIRRSDNGRYQEQLCRNCTITVQTCLSLLHCLSNVRSAAIVMMRGEGATLQVLTRVLTASNHMLTMKDSTCSSFRICSRSRADTIMTIKNMFISSSRAEALQGRQEISWLPLIDVFSEIIRIDDSSSVRRCAVETSLIMEMVANRESGLEASARQGYARLYNTSKMSPKVENPDALPNTHKTLPKDPLTDGSALDFLTKVISEVEKETEEIKDTDSDMFKMSLQEEGSGFDNKFEGSGKVVLEGNDARALHVITNKLDLLTQLVELTTGSAEREQKVKAEKLISSLCEDVYQRKQGHEKILNELVNMAYSNNERHIELLAHALRLLTANMSSRKHVARYPALLESLAKIASDGSSTTRAKEDAAGALLNLARDDANGETMICQAVLSALVEIAASSSHEQNQSRTFAVEAIIELASSVPNRRLMAMQVGMMSSLIRFVGADGNSDLKDAVKDTIMKLVSVG